MMLRRDQFESYYWKHYLLLERKLLDASDYVEISMDNQKTYSRVFVGLLLEIGVEFENIAKTLVADKSITNKKRYTITNYAKAILEKFPDIVNQTVGVFYTAIGIQPFSNWDKEKASQTLLFWSRYNKVKHNRVLYYTDASLESVMEGLAALFVLNMNILDYLFDIDEECKNNWPAESSRLFSLKEWEQRYRSSKTGPHHTIIDVDNTKVDL